MKFTLLLVCFLALLMPQLSSQAFAGCNPATSNCLGLTCDRVGATTMDHDQKSIVACLLNDMGTPVWKGAPGGGVYQGYTQSVFGTLNMGIHDICALTRVMRVAWGDATMGDCKVDRLADGTWTLYNRFQKNADIQNGNLICEAICLNNTSSVSGITATCPAGQILQGFSAGVPTCVPNVAASYQTAGTYATSTSGGCTRPNNITGSCSCPSGYTPKLAFTSSSGGFMGGGSLYMCYGG